MATSISYATSGLVDGWLAGLFVVRGPVGGLIGSRLGQVLSERKQMLGPLFAALVIVVGFYIVSRAVLALAED